jgi:thiol:disulfide interchange protein DsbD
MVFLAGVATSLTPCVYPMIAITVSVFGAREVKSRWEAAGLSTAYVLGIAALFTPLGLVAGVTGGVFGSLLANPYVLVGLALLFSALAASMFGAFELALPSALQNRLAQLGGVGPRGAFVLGFVSGLIAAPCTGPVLAFLLTWIGTTGRVTFGGLALFTYSLGLGVLFWVVGTFAVSLPKSGRWLDWVKSVFGVVMLVMAVYFVRDLLPFARPVTRAAPWLWGGLALAAVGLALGAVHHSFHAPSGIHRAQKSLGIASMVLGVTAALWWAEALPPGAKVTWLENYSAAKSLAEKDKRPLLVDVSASWCGACGRLDRETFSDPRVVSAIARLNAVAVRVDLSPGQGHGGEQSRPCVVLAARIAAGGPPSADGTEALRLTDFAPADEFLTLLGAKN